MTPTSETPREIAKRLSVSERTVYRWIEQHGLKATVEDGVLRVASGTLDRFLEGTRPRKSRNAAAADDVVEHLFRAAAEVVSKEGPFGLTLGKIAAAANVSVGSVTYHFASRDELVEALLERFFDAFEAAWRAAEANGQSVGAAYLEVTQRPEADGASLRALLVLTASSPSLARSAQGRVRAWYRRLAAEGHDMLLRCLAADALWLFEVIGLSPLGPANRAAVLR
jgi:excisionase family DNA binding protein